MGLSVCQKLGSFTSEFRQSPDGSNLSRIGVGIGMSILPSWTIFPSLGGLSHPTPQQPVPVDIPVLDTMSRTYWQWILCTLLDRNHLGSLPIPVRSPAIFPCWVNYLTIHHHNHGLQTSQNLIDHQEHIVNEFSALCLTEFPLNPAQFH